MISLLDILLIVLDWFKVLYLEYKFLKYFVKFIGKFVLLLLEYDDVVELRDTVYVSYNLYEIIMYYLMRVIRIK